MLVFKGAKSVKPGRSSQARRVRRLLIGGLAIVLGLYLAVMLAGYALRAIAIGQIVELTGAKVASDSIRANLRGWVRIKGLSISPADTRVGGDTILTAEQVDARFSIASLLLLRPRLEELKVRGFVLDALYNLDAGKWNVGTLNIAFPSGRGGVAPTLRLEEGKLRYGRVSKAKVQIVAEVPVEAGLEPSDEADDAYDFRITTAERPYYGKSTLEGLWRSGCIVATGSISSADVGAFQRVWTVSVIAGQLLYDENNDYSLKLRIKDLLSTRRPGSGTFTLDSDAFLGKTDPFTALQRFFDRYRPAGRAYVKLNMDGNFERLNSTRVQGTIDCNDVSVCDRKFPYSVEHISGRIDFDNEAVRLKQLNGRHGDVKVTFDGWSKGYASHRAYEIQLSSKNMALDGDLFDALTDKRKKSWSAFSPGGIAAIDYRVTREPGKAKKKTLAVELLGSEAVYRGFAYPLKNLTGRLLFQGGSVTASNIVSEFDGRKVSIDGQLTSHPAGRPEYEFTIVGENIPLDSTLMEALPGKQKDLLNPLDMKGFADAKVRISSEVDDTRAREFIADISLRQTSLKFDLAQNAFSERPDRLANAVLPISDINARLIVTPDLVGIENLSGIYEHSVVSANGRIRLTDQVKPAGYCLSLGVQGLELTDELTRVLPESARTVVSGLRPKGKINLQVDLNKNGLQCPDSKVVIACLGNSIELPLISEASPYPLRNVTGRLIVTSDNIELEDIRTTALADDASTSRAMLIVNGEIALSNGAFNRGSFRLTGSDVPLDKRLESALPGCIRPLYVKLSPRGRIDFDLGNLKILRTAEGKSNVDFQGAVELKDCSLNIQPAVTDINAMLQIEGSYTTDEGLRNNRIVVSDGQGRIKGKALKKLSTDIYYDTDKRSWLSKKLVADFYHGDLTGRFELRHSTGAALQYLLEVGFADVDMGQFFEDTTRKDGLHTSGKMNGSLSVSGSTTGVSHDDTSPSRIGRCRLTITDMQVGRVSPLAKLLSVLRLTEPRDYAFDRMVVDSYIKDDRLFLESLDVAGESVAFSGSGGMNLKNEQVNLVLYARGRRVALTEPSLWQSLTESIGSAVVRLEVTGNIHHPKVITKPLPVIRNTLKIFGADRPTPNP